MKKVLLLLSAGVVVISANAQERRASTSVVFNHAKNDARQAPTAGDKALVNSHSSSTARTTAGPGGSRWYNYVDSILGPQVPTTLAGLGATLLPLWNDTTAVIGYSGPTYDINTWTSVGTTLNPYYTPFNDSVAFPAEIMIGGTDAYTVDQVTIGGSYQRPLTAGTYVDTLRLAFVYGTGASTTDIPNYFFDDGGVSTAFPMVPYGVDTLDFIALIHDSLHNEAGVVSGTGSRVTYNFLLNATDTASAFQQTYTVNFPVPAGNFVGMSLGFRSGDPSYTPFDTISYDDGTSKHGNFAALIAYDADVSGNPAWPIFDVTDQNQGHFKREGSMDAGWGGVYIPLWAWSTSSGTAPSALQYLYAPMHITCATCAWTSGGTPTTAVGNTASVLNSVSAYPNPATSELNITFTATNSNATVSLTNMVGQVVATLKNVTNGVATFNTAALPAGVYIYTISANGSNATGRVVVAH